MNTKWVAAIALMGTMAVGVARADDPNPDVAKAIQEIAARRADKEEARVKQVESWAKGEGRERAGAPGANPATPYIRTLGQNLTGGETAPAQKAIEKK